MREPPTTVPRATRDSSASRVELLPLFPLSNVVLFPQITVPLYIFELRYRQMIEAALAGSERIGMVTAVPEQLDEMAGDPEIFPIGCIGKIESSSKRSDGTYDIMLVGVARFRIEHEPPRTEGQLFRQAQTTLLIDDAAVSDPEALRDLREQVHDRYGRLLERLAPRYLEQFQAHDFSQVSNTIYTNTISASLDIDSIEKQSLLEASSTSSRLERLLAVLDFKLADQLARRSTNPESIQ